MVMVQNYKCPNSEEQASYMLSRLRHALPLSPGTPVSMFGFVCLLAEMLYRGARHLQAYLCDGDYDVLRKPQYCFCVLWP